MGQADRTHFEQEWRDAFEDAGMTPPTHVWEGIEKSLHGATKSHKRIFLIQLAMAASVLFAMSIGAAGVYQVFFKESTQPSPVAGQRTDTSAGALQPEEMTELPRPEKGSEIVRSPSSGGPVTSGSEESGRRQLAYASEGTESSDDPQQAGTLVEGSLVSSFDIDHLNPFESSLAFSASLSETIPQGVPYSIVPSSKSRTSSSAWAALGVSTGSYRSGSGVSDSYMLGASFDNANAIRVGVVSEEATGSVFQVEMNFGKRIAPKWILQGGIGYMERNSDGISNIVSAYGGAVSNASAERFSQAVVAAPYEIENSLQLITVPVQVGYIILDKKIGLRVLTGIANELMLQYRVDDTEGNLSSQSYKPGDSDEYNSYGMSALVSTEVSYTMADRYQVAVQPRMRQSLLPLRETDEALPRAMELGFAVRYLFQ